MLKYEVLRQQLIYTIQNSGLNIGAAFFILKDVFHEVEALYKNTVEAELDEKKQENNANENMKED